MGAHPFAFRVTAQVLANCFLRWNWMGGHCHGSIFWQIFSGNTVIVAHWKITGQVNGMWGKKVWKQDMKGYRWTRHVYKQNESPTSSIFWLSFWHLSYCNEEVESYTILKVYLHNCLVVIKEPRIISSLPCANLFIHFIVHFTEVTKTFLQIVLFILYIFMYICIYVWLYLYWLWWVVWELWKKCWHYLSGPQCIKKKKKKIFGLWKIYIFPWYLLLQFENLFVLTLWQWRQGVWFKKADKILKT